MKRKLILLTSVFALALCAVGVSTTVAQTNSTPPPQPPPPHEHGFRGPPPGVSKEDWDKLQKTKKEVIESTPDLKAQQDAFKAEREKMKANRENGEKPSDADRKAAMDKMKAFEEQVKAAVIKQDPSLAAVYDAIEKARAEAHKDKAATPPPAPATPKS